MKKALLLGFALTTMVAVAAPTKAELQSVSSLVQELMRPELEALKTGKKTKADVAKAAMTLASQADSPAAKQVLCIDGFTYYVKAGEYEEAEAAFAELLKAIPDFPPEEQQTLLEKALYPVPNKDAAPLRARLADLKASASQRLQLKRLLAQHKAAPRASTATRIAVLYAGLNDWPQALKYFAACDDEDYVKAAKLELAAVAEGKPATGPVADAWWDLSQSRSESVRRPLRAHAAAIYEAALPNLTGLSKVAAERRVAETKEASAPAESSRVVSRALPGTRLEYLESNGQQWIDTGVVPDAGTRVEIDSLTILQLGTWLEICGSGTSDVSEDCFELRLVSGMSSIGTRTGNPSGGQFSNYSCPIEVGKKYSSVVFDIDGLRGRELRGQRVDGKVNRTIAGKNTMYLFASNNSGTAFRPSAIRLGGVRIWQNNRLLRDFVPLLRKDGKRVMYDLVTRQSFPGQGPAELMGNK